MVSFYFLLSLLGGILFSSFGLLVYLKNKSGSSNRIFGLLSLSFAVWDYSWFLMFQIHTNENTAIFLSRLLNLGATWIPIFYIHWVLTVLEINKNWKKYLLIGYILTIIFSLVSFSSLYISGVHSVDYFRYWPTPGHLYLFFLIFGYINFFITGLIILFIKIRKSKGYKKSQIIYIILGSIFGILGGATNFIFMYEIKFLMHSSILFIGQIFLILLSIIFAYAAIKYRLMNIRLMLTRSILYGVLVVLVAGFFSLSVFFVGNVLGGNNQTSKIFTYVITALIIVIALDPVKRVFAKLTDNIFYKDRIDYQKVSQQASAVVAREIDLEKLSYSLSNLLATELKIKEVSALIAKEQVFTLISTSQQTKQNLKLSIDFISLIQERKDFIIIEELIRAQSDIGSEAPYYQVLDKFIKEAESYNVEMVVPIADDSGVITAIFLFSAKSSGDLYNQDDINFLKVLVPQIATAIEKSKLYEEVQAFNRELQAKVEDRTKSLREANLGLEERNKFLTTMQVVINMISRTLDLKQVNQMIANSITLELGYVGGVLSFIDETTHTLKIGAITENEKTKDIISILGRDPKKFEAQLNPEFSLGAQTVLSGKINFSEKMSDFFSPPVDKGAIDKVQEFLGVKTVVGLPIFSENKIIGIIHFLLAVERHHISALDIETMTALTNQVGIVSRNLRLYNNLQSTNMELQDANLRLRELDRAKSEFLSIASHQLRTPISALKGYLSMMIDGDFGPLPEKIQGVIKDLFESASRLARLINVFLNVSRIESGRLKLEKHPIQINDLIVGVIKELNNQALQKKLELSYQVPATALPLVNADSDKLREVILNLIDNSIKYTLEGSIKVSVSVDQENFHFFVKDTGIGIDPEEAKTLFRKFVRGSGVAQIHTGGSGLGLFIAQKIIKEHGGQVWAESEGKGKGSTFQFVIPIKGAEPKVEDKVEDSQDKK